MKQQGSRRHTATGATLSRALLPVARPRQDALLRLVEVEVEKHGPVTRMAKAMVMARQCLLIVTASRAKAVRARRAAIVQPKFAGPTAVASAGPRKRAIYARPS